MKIDLCTITQGKERYYSFLSQAYGVMADVDLGTEHMRYGLDDKANQSCMKQTASLHQADSMCCANQMDGIHSIHGGLHPEGSGRTTL